MSHISRTIQYFERMTEIELSASERASLTAFQDAPDFTRDSDWPGWLKYLGPRPAPRHLAIVTPLHRRSA